MFIASMGKNIVRRVSRPGSTRVRPMRERRRKPRRALSRAKAPERVEVRLFWFTTGSAPRQIGMAAKAVFANPSGSDTRRFEFVLPAKPWSFEGRLAGLRWAVEAVLL